MDRVVSFDDEPLILVDSEDREVGFLPKADAHVGAGHLHRAFSLFLFDFDGRLLLQQRAPGKRLWPNYWSNTVCSHPRRGEPMDAAVARRLDDELGLQCSLEYLFKFQYQAQFDDRGAENELCWVYAGRIHGQPQFNPNEISAMRFIAPDALDADFVANPDLYTPWFKIEWARIRREFSHVFAAS